MLLFKKAKAIRMNTLKIVKILLFLKTSVSSNNIK